MSSIKGKGWGPYSFTRAAYDEQRDCELQFNLSIKIEMHAGFQKGVYVIKVRSEAANPDNRHLNHAIEGSWPLSNAQSFEAYLYQLMHKLARMVENADLDWWNRHTPRVKGG